MSIDDNAKFRQPTLVALKKSGLGKDAADPNEERASLHQLNYVALDGNIACMVNGAGLAMATMDMLKLHGCQPANFLDVGGDVTIERTAIAFEILMNHPNVDTVFVNIYGGILSCRDIAEGIVQTMKK